METTIQTYLLNGAADKRALGGEINKNINTLASNEDIEGLFN